ncbi:Cytosolic copper metallochaperone [Dimargaris xerosporica]|nr:Cytosolic copper metallochaperone [Dimargaris xerosporica]
MSSSTYKFDVKMPCSGCSNAVTKALKNSPGVEQVSADLETQTVMVTTTLSQQEVLEIIQKTGKEAHPQSA